MSRHGDTEPVLPQTTEQRVEKVEKQVRTGVTERRAYIVLVLLSVFFSVIVYVAGQVKQNQDEHKFCDIMTFSLAAPVPPKPADPKLHPSRDRAYEGYQKAKELSHALGCS